MSAQMRHKAPPDLADNATLELLHYASVLSLELFPSQPDASSYRRE